MKQPNLNYRFQNPNPAEDTAEYLTRLFVESNTRKVEQAIKESADQIPGNHENEDVFL